MPALNSPLFQPQFSKYIYAFFMQDNLPFIQQTKQPVKLSIALLLGFKQVKIKGLNPANLSVCSK